MPKPLISILIPNHNSHTTLEETISSIKTKYPYEVIISDDASDEPATLSMLEKLSHEHTVIYNTQNNGPAVVLNAAAKVAQGKYIMELDSDDLLTDDALDTLIGYLESHDNIDVVWGDLITFGHTESKKAMAPVLDPWYVTHLNNMPCCSMMRKSAFDKAGGWQVKRPGYHDWGMWIALALSGAQGKKLDIVMLKYRVSESGMFLSSRSRYMSRRKATQDVFTGLRSWRMRTWFKSQAPWRLKLMLPIYLALPIEPYKKSRQAKAWAAKYWFFDEESYQARITEKETSPV